MLALDQTIDPIRGFFLPFSFSKKAFRSVFRGAYGEAANASIEERTEKGLASKLVSAPIVILLVHVIVNATIFSLFAGMCLGIFYLAARFEVAVSFLKIATSVALVCDLALFLLSFINIVVRTLRDV